MDTPPWQESPLAYRESTQFIFGKPTRRVERSGSGVDLRTLNYENPGSNPGCGVKTLGKFFHSTLLQFIQLN